MKLKLSLLLLCLFALSPAEALADNFVITNVSGYVFLPTSDFGPNTLKISPDFDLSGPGLRVRAGGHEPLSGDVPARDLCISDGCAPGTLLSLNSSFSGVLDRNMSDVWINGVIAPGYGSPDVTITGDLNFVSPQFIVLSPGGSTVTVPFVFSGTLRGDSSALVPGLVNPIFTATLSGQGLATFTFAQIQGTEQAPRFRLASIDYQFQQPIPEPATLLLLGTGLVGVVGVARRRRGAARRDSWRTFRTEN